MSTEDRSKWTTGDWAKHVGARADKDGVVSVL
jgi:hypothetical protein